MSTSDKSIHNGHRERLRKEFLNSGFESFSDVRALELLLFYSHCRIDTNPIAHELLNHFHSLYNVLNASVDELKKVSNIGENTAILIKIAGEINRKALIEKNNEKKTIFSNSEIAVSIIKPYLYGLKIEKFFIFCLDSNNRLIKAVELERGIINSVNIDIRKAVEAALFCSASAVIFAHNHPGGKLYPSEEDIKITNRLSEALSTVCISVLDHVIISDDESFSFADSGLIK